MADLSQIGGILGTALVSGALASIDQTERPIVLLRLNNNVPRWLHWVVPRPEDMSYTHPTRAAAIHTLGGAYVDDFGPGIVQISLRATTGYKMDILQNLTGAVGLAAGDVMLFNLREALINAFHQERKALADNKQDPEGVQLLLVDTLNLAVWRVYPREFQVQRNRQRPLLYQYLLTLWGLEKLL
jgi:hypothetical protein